MSAFIHNYSQIPTNVRQSLQHFNRNDIFDNLHTIIHEDNDETEPQIVEKFQYQQELDKSLLSRASIIGLGLGLMNPVLGMCTSMSIGLINGGPLSIMIGFLVSGVGVWFSSLSLGEIISKFPMEIHIGSAMLAPDSFKLVSSWYTGWLMLIGNWTMSTSITFAGAQLTTSLFMMTRRENMDSLDSTLLTVTIFYFVVTMVGLINIKGGLILDKINRVCVWSIVASIIFIDIVLLIFHEGRYRSLNYALFHFDNSMSGYSAAILSFIVAFQQSNFTLQGFSMLPSISDEVKVPEKDVSRGMSDSVLICTFSGLIFLIPIMIILPDLDNIFKNDQILPIVNIFTQSTHSLVVSICLVLPILGNLLFSGISSITTSSRAVYCFSRDHGIPYHDAWTFVASDSEYKVPKNSVLLSMAVSYILGILALFSKTAFDAFIGAAVLCLCSATCIPLILVLLRRRRVLKNAPVKIRYKLGWGINIISILWLLLSMFSVCLPTRIPITANTMNYAIVVYVFCLIIITLLYFKWGKYNLKLPLAKDVDINILKDEEANINLPVHPEYELTMANDTTKTVLSDPYPSIQYESNDTTKIESSDLPENQDIQDNQNNQNNENNRNNVIFENT